MIKSRIIPKKKLILKKEEEKEEKCGIIYLFAVFAG